jgi:hypothetical protein
MNLLPKTEKENLKKGLKSRFTIVALSMLSLSLFVGFIMLLPSYFLVSSYLSEVVSENNISKSKDDASIKKILNLPVEISSKLDFFQSNISDISVVDYFSKVIGYLPKGVRLDSVSFSRNSDKGKNSTVVLVSGTSLDRDSLVSFSTLLENSNLFSSVEVPVSSLTRDKNLPFSMNLLIKSQK